MSIGRGRETVREVFKYRAINEYTLSFLGDGAVYFSSPHDFNDPFDSRFIDRDLSAQRADYERYWISLGKQASMLGVGAMRTFENAMRNRARQSRICCFSDLENSVLMWSHYSDSHRGICVILEAEEEAGFLWLRFQGRSLDYSGGYSTISGSKGTIEKHGPLVAAPDIIRLPIHPVRYQEEAPGLFQFFDGPDGTPRAVTFELIKHRDWSYEKERRVVLDGSQLAENPAYLETNVIVGVIFGLKTSQGDARRVVETIESCEPHRRIRYFYMIPGLDGVGLQRVSIPRIGEFIESMQ